MWSHRWTVRCVLCLTMMLVAACGRPGATDAPPPAESAAPTSAPILEAAATATITPPQPTATQTSSTVAASQEVDFEPLVALIQEEMATQQIPGLSIAVIHQGRALFQQGFGVANVAKNSEVTPATLFRIGSITKPLTAIGVLQLVEAGAVALDAPVVTYLPEFAVNDQITVRHLLSHSSGLGDAAIPYGRTDAAALQEYVASLSPASAFAPPGEVFSYSNPGYNVLGRLIEAVSGMAYADYMMERVFPTLGMAHTTFDRPSALAAGLALGYYPGRGAPQLEERDPDNGAEYPSGFAFSNVEDLTRLALFLLSDGQLDGEQHLQPALVQAMKTPVVHVEPLALGYGLGLLSRMRAGETVIGHNGTINGYAATLEVLPSEELAVIVLSNRHNYDPARITQAAFDLLTQLTRSAPAQEILLDESVPAAYVGRYLMASAFPTEQAEGVTVGMEQGHLTASLPGATFELRAVGDDLFDAYVPQVAQPVTQFAFLRDDTQAIRYLHFGLHALPRVAE